MASPEHLNSEKEASSIDDSNPEDFVEKILTCPYNPRHKICNSRFRIHLIKCEKRYPHIKLYPCYYNFSHKLKKHELQEHYKTCPDRIQIESDSELNDFRESVEDHAEIDKESIRTSCDNEDLRSGSSLWSDWDYSTPLKNSKSQKNLTSERYVRCYYNYSHKLNPKDVESHYESCPSKNELFETSSERSSYVSESPKRALPYVGVTNKTSITSENVKKHYKSCPSKPNPSSSSHVFGSSKQASSCVGENNKTSITRDRNFDDFRNEPGKRRNVRNASKKKGYRKNFSNSKSSKNQFKNKGDDQQLEATSLQNCNNDHIEENGEKEDKIEGFFKQHEPNHTSLSSTKKKVLNFEGANVENNQDVPTAENEEEDLSSLIDELNVWESMSEVDSSEQRLLSSKNYRLRQLFHHKIPKTLE